MTASLKDKLTALSMLLSNDDLTEQVLKQAVEAEKAADKAGMEFKEMDDSTTKAKKKVVPPEDMEDGDEADGETEGEEPADEESVEEAKPAKGKIPPQFMKRKKEEGDEDIDADADDEDVDELADGGEFDEDEFDDESPEEEKEYADYVGDLPVAALSEMIAETWKEAFAPVAELLQLNIEAMRTTIETVKESKSTDAIDARLDALTEQVKELTGDIPKAVKAGIRGYRATEDPKTVVEGGEEALKEVGPGRADPAFLKFLGMGK